MDSPILDESRRRMLLKDFLVDHHHELPSCSSRNDDLKKKSWNQQPAARKPYNNNNNKFISRARRSSSSRILSLRHSIKAASVSISAAIKFLPYIATIKTTTAAAAPSAINNYLPRSISRKLSSCRTRNMQVLEDSDHHHRAVSVDKVVKIKDILRWKSFRDINNATEMEEIIMPLPSSVEFSCSPNQYISSTTAAPTTDLSTAAAAAVVSGDKDWIRVSEDRALEFSKHYLRDFPADQGTTLSKREIEFNDEDQHSPVSVLDSPFHEQDEAFPSFFQRNLASIERRKCKLMQRIEEFESLGYKNLERSSDQFSADNDGDHVKHMTINDNDAAVREKAAQLLSRVLIKGTGTEISGEHNNIKYQMLFDYFVEELTTAGGGSCKSDEDGEMLRFAESWLSNSSCKEGGCNNGGDGYYFWEWEMMEKGLRDSWNFSCGSRFEEEKGGLGCNLEKMLLNDLVDEILFDLLSIK